MIRTKVHSGEFARDMRKIIGYAEGFLQGAEAGKTNMMENVGAEVIDELKNFIDVNARINPSMMHHVYEWYQTGSPSARLFDLDYQVSNFGLSVGSTFRQSVTVRKGSTVPFYNKARIMENGIPVRIEPRSKDVLRFIENGEEVFTKKPINVIDPGGEAVQGAYERVFEMFFNQYFTQSFIRHSRVFRHLDDPSVFKLNFNKAKRGGKSAGFSVGFRWMSQGGI